MKKLLLILLCVPLMFSCGENHKSENSIEKESSNEEYTGGPEEYTGGPEEYTGGPDKYK